MLLLASSAAASDFTLGIFGNANEDGKINMQDVTYTELIILEYRDQTELADAKYDGKINMQDVTQIELIILGKELELTIIDFADRIVKVNKPVERVTTLHYIMADAIRMLGSKDKIVGVDTYTTTLKVYLPEISELPSVGQGHGGDGPDIEALLNLEPDMAITYQTHAAGLDEKLPDNIAVVGISLHHPADIREEVMKLGYILDKRNEAVEFIDFHDEYIDPIKALTEGLSEEERPKVYLEFSKPYRTYAGNSYDQQKIDTAGGRNIFADIPGLGSINVDPEEVVMRNPDIIVLKQYKSAGNLGYERDDPSLAETARDVIMSRPELANVGAVKSERVYVILGTLSIGPAYPICIAYYAKWFHPDLFEDLDPQRIHQEYIDRFCPGLDFDVSEHGVFVYPPLEEL
jgi:iron complex transport system substrate-binding protein